MSRTIVVIDTDASIGKKIRRACGPAERRLLKPLQSWVEQVRRLHSAWRRCPEQNQLEVSRLLRPPAAASPAEIHGVAVNPERPVLL